MISTRVSSALLAAALFTAPVGAQSPRSGASQPPARPNTGRGQSTPPAAPSRPGPSGADTSNSVTAPPGYVIGADDVLTISFWREKDMSGDVIVRPDGMISVPLINEVMAAGQTPDQLRQALERLAAKYVEDTNCVVVVKAINSRKVFITGMVNKVGAYPLTSPINVLQLITMAGGLLDFAHEEDITVVRMENGVQKSYGFNYKEVMKRKKLTQNITLQPGDVVLVP